MGVINMLNAEKYRAEILGKDFKFGLSNRICKCCYKECATCVFSLENNPNDGLSHACTIRKVKWLLSEYREPVKLTKFECDILEYALKNTDYRFITRDDEDKLYFYSVKPKKYNRYWQYLAQNQRRLLSDDLFRFVQWKDSEPTEIEDVLNNFEVIENDL